MTAFELDFTTLAAASALILINAGLSLALELGLARRLLVAALRMIVQLALIGLGASCIASSALVAAVFALGARLSPGAWYDPRYAIPLLGMVLGNAMTGIALGLNTLTQAVTAQKAGIEARLALGEDRRRALLGPARQAARNALLQTINSMAATGLVFLPGMMTGQILAGAEPGAAVKYQLMVMFLIAGCTGVGAIVAIVSGAARLTDTRHRLRLDRLAPERRD